MACGIEGPGSGGTAGRTGPGEGRPREPAASSRGLRQSRRGAPGGVSSLSLHFEAAPPACPSPSAHTPRGKSPEPLVWPQASPWTSPGLPAPLWSSLGTHPPPRVVQNPLPDLRWARWGGGLLGTGGSGTAGQPGRARVRGHPCSDHAGSFRSSFLLRPFHCSRQWEWLSAPTDTLSGSLA